MGLKRTKLLGIHAVTGINTVGILTVGVTETAGGVGIASTTYFRGMVMHNTGISTAVGSIYIYPNGVASDGSNGNSLYRLANVELAESETYFFEMNYPLVLVDGEKVVVEVSTSNAGPTAVGTTVNFQILGDTDI